MPASKSSKWFITVSPCDWSDIDQKVVALQSQVYVEYHVIKEYGSDGSHPHVHAYLSGNVVESQEVVRRRWMKCLPANTQFVVALKVVKCTDRDRLIGAYMSKDAKVEILYSNLSNEVLDSLKAEYAHINKAKANPSKWKYPKLDSMPDVMEKYCEARGMTMTTHAEFKDVLRSMMANGYNLINILGRMKYVWSQIAAMKKVHDDMSYMD